MRGMRKRASECMGFMIDRSSIAPENVTSVHGTDGLVTAATGATDDSKFDSTKPKSISEAEKRN